MATIAIGDIHGNATALDDLLGRLHLEDGSDDTVVFLGDYIDRGPDTRACIDAILRFRDEVSGEVVCLCGNHEDWMLGTLRDPRRHSWLLGIEALDTVRSYSVDAERALRDAMSAAGLASWTVPAGRSPASSIGSTRLPTACCRRCAFQTAGSFRAAGTRRIGETGHSEPRDPTGRIRGRPRVKKAQWLLTTV